MYEIERPLHRRREQNGSYFLPFISIIILGLIAILVFQIFGYFRQKRAQALENKAAVTIVSGNAELKVWGVDQWVRSYDGNILNSGDALRTSSSSRAVLSLLNGSVIRLDSDTEVELTDLKTRDTQDEALITLKRGQIWLRRSENDAVRASFVVRTPHIEVTSLGTIFNVGFGERESVRVLEGKVRVGLKVEDSEGESSTERTADIFEVDLGQELSIGAQEVAMLRERKPYEGVTLLSDVFRNSEWYTWNRSQDEKPEAEVSVADAVEGATTAPTTDTPPAATPTPTPAPQSTPITATAPVILTPKESERTTKTGTVVISGTVSDVTEKVEVTAYAGDEKGDTHTLQKYKAGSLNWSYTASKLYGNLKAGANRFVIIAIGKNGIRSEPSEVTIIYDKPKEAADMSAPKVLKFNNTTSSETTSHEVRVDGTIGKGIEKVVVNDFTLSQYVEGSGVWVYFARTSSSNLKEGENQYEVYGIDAEGNKTPVTKFTITKKAVEATTPPAAPAINSEPPPAAIPTGPLNF